MNSTKGALQAVALLLTAKQGKRTVWITGSVSASWAVLKFTANAIGIECRFNETDRIVRPDGGGSVRVVASDDKDRLRGHTLDAAVVDRRTPAIDRALGPRMSPGSWTVYVDEAIEYPADPPPFTHGPPLPPAPAIEEPNALKCLGRVYAIEGHRVEVHGTFPGAFEPGMRIVGDNDRLGRAPNAGCATVESIDPASTSITLDSPWSASLTTGDYLFEKPPTAEELRAAEVERRLTTLERAASGAPGCLRRVTVDPAVVERLSPEVIAKVRAESEAVIKAVGDPIVEDFAARYFASESAACHAKCDADDARTEYRSDGKPVEGLRIPPQTDPPIVGVAEQGEPVRLRRPSAGSTPTGTIVDPAEMDKTRAFYASKLTWTLPPDATPHIVTDKDLDAAARAHMLATDHARMAVMVAAHSGALGLDVDVATYADALRLVLDRYSEIRAERDRLAGEAEMRAKRDAADPAAVLRAAIDDHLFGAEGRHIQMIKDAGDDQRALRSMRADLFAARQALITEGVARNAAETRLAKVEALRDRYVRLHGVISCERAADELTGSLRAVEGRWR